ncbi:hypothetical protein TWF106_009943 [Orbilia oligospora]|uniref:AMP-dependent synthetase/ligase domain-containing protein n=1 Tax=Orbilia oligospora TaxID=2813651 RepID=A0A7C8QX18_ORBOL|nr:hypothetical protein TWF106_009943 [Orbilia oligospora]
MTIPASQPKLLWTHPSPENTHLFRFKEHIKKKYQVEFGPETASNSLYQWSIDHPSLFWAEVWEFTGVKASKLYSKVIDETAPIFPRPAWFEGARLNFAENLLYPASIKDDSGIAVIAATEVSRETITWKQLRERVRRCSAALRSCGLKEGDRVAAYVGNHANTLVAALSTSAIGAIWTATSPDVGATAVLDRFAQIEPTVLFVDNAVIYNGKTHDNMSKVKEIVKQLPSVRTIVVFPSVPGHQTSIHPRELRAGQESLLYPAFLTLGPATADLRFAQLEPDHPLYILYSSGTTGKPKCIVHGAVGTLIQHKKEHQLCSDMGPGDIFFQFTTVAWMMWHYNVSALASGATILLYDGSPFRPLVDGNGDLAIPKLIDEIGVTCFGTSAKYLSILEQNNAMPHEKFPMEKLRAIYSTGSVLAPSTFDYVYKAFGPNLNLGSITGGTDIISLFGAPSPLVPVYSGEIQCIGLGMAVQAWDVDGKAVEDEPADLVCTKPFPCMPVKFWGVEGEKAYRRSYFEHFEGVWHHGDFIKINSKTRGLLMLGRSDGILKPAGVRFGSSEIYNVLLSRFPLEFEDALCIGRRRPNDLDETVVLFVKMASGYKFSEELVKSIKDTIRTECSGRHVPAIVDETPEIPVTTNGKKIEVAVKQILCGMDVKTSASVSNPGCLDWYRNWLATH